MENDAAGFPGRQLERLQQMPGDGFPLPVLIGGQPDRIGLPGQLGELRHHFLLVGGHHVLRLEAVFHIHAQLMLFQVPDVADGGLHQIIFP